jgi:hypothetical protein
MSLIESEIIKKSDACLASHQILFLKQVAEVNISFAVFQALFHKAPL